MLGRGRAHDVAKVDLERDAWKALHEARYEGCQQHPPIGAVGQHTQGAGAQFGERRGPLAHGVSGGEDGTTMGQQLLPSGGEREAPGRPPHQAQTEFRFELGDRPTDRGLGHAEGPGSGRKAVEVDDLGEHRHVRGRPD